MVSRLMFNLRGTTEHSITAGATAPTAPAPTTLPHTLTNIEDVAEVTAIDEPLNNNGSLFCGHDGGIYSPFALRTDIEMLQVCKRAGV